MERLTDTEAMDWLDREWSTPSTLTDHSAQDLINALLVRTGRMSADDLGEDAYIKARDPLQGRDPDELHERGR